MNEHYCLFCCTKWSIGKCSKNCTHRKGEICQKQKEGLKLPFSLDKLPYNFEWAGLLGGSYFNTYALAELFLNKIQRGQSKIIKIKTQSSDICFKILYPKQT